MAVHMGEAWLHAHPALGTHTTLNYLGSNPLPHSDVCTHATTTIHQLHPQPAPSFALLCSPAALHVTNVRLPCICSAPFSYDISVVLGNMVECGQAQQVRRALPRCRQRGGASRREVWEGRRQAQQVWGIRRALLPVGKEKKGRQSTGRAGWRPLHQQGGGQGCPGSGLSQGALSSHSCHPPFEFPLSSWSQGRGGGGWYSAVLPGQLMHRQWACGCGRGGCGCGGTCWVASHRQLEQE